MDFSNVPSRSNPHQRTIIHLDMDYYYAQVEEIRDPTLRTRPLGIQQGNIVVTSNYVAREFGISKLATVAEAKRLCPKLVLVNGEDLAPYRLMSNRVFEILLTYTPTVEKLCLDENFLDVTSLVEKREEQRQQGVEVTIEGATTTTTRPSSMVVGNIFPTDCSLSDCDCGCATRLAIGTQIAKEIRDNLYAKLGITCSAGIAYNKLLAKLVGAQHKPNQQTVLVSSRSEEFMRHLRGLHRVTGIGQKTESLLLESGIGNIEDLQRCDMEFLRKKFGFETATKLKNLSFGRDTGNVRVTGKPKTIGLEDSCRPISVRVEVEERFRMLLMRLNEKVAEDGRIPIAIKIILRKYDTQKKTSHRESKQANILPSLFTMTTCNDTGNYKVTLTDGAHEKLLKIIMRLFERIIDMNKPFNITLIGLAFSKFQQRKVGSSSIANFLIKKTDLEVQSITSLTNTSVVTTTSESPTPSVSSTNSDEAFRSSPTTFQPSDQFYRRRTMAASPIPMLVDNGSESAATNSDFSDFSETEVEPSPKKSRIGRLLMAKRRCLGSASIQNATDAMDVASPSKLRVCDLRLNSRDSEKDMPNSSNTPMTTNSLSSSSTCTAMATPSSCSLRVRTVRPPSTLLSRIDCGVSGVAKQLPIKSPLASPMDDYCNDTAATTPTTPISTTTIADPTKSHMQDFVISTTSSITMHSSANNNNNCEMQTIASTAAVTSATTNLATTIATTTITGNLANIPCPNGVDPHVFNELPLDVQNELIASWRSSLAAAAAAVNGSGGGGGVGSNSAPAAGASNTAKAGGATSNSSSATQKNTLYRYFLRNK